MERKQMSGFLPCTGYEAFGLPDQHERNLCDGLSQLNTVEVNCEVVK